MPADHARRSAELLAQPGAATATLNWYRALPLAAVSPRRPRRVTVPTLYLWSTADRFLGRAAAEACGRFVDGAYRLQVLHGVSHWIPETAPDDVARLVLGHVRSHPA